MAEILEIDTAMPMADVGTVAVIEPVKRGFSATQEMEVSSAKKQRPDFSSSEREVVCYQCHSKGHYKRDCRSQPSAAAK